MSFVVSAPGKLILMGEHAAVYGKPALVTAIDRRVRAVFESLVDADATADTTVDAPVHLVLPAVGVDETTSWRAVRAYADQRRIAWKRYAERPSPVRFEQVRGDDPAHLVKVALGEAVAAIPDAWAPPALRLRLSSDIPLGGGFGSSAAVSVSVVYGVFCLAGAPPMSDVLARVALDAERRQHGLPSGIDTAIVQQGGLLWGERDAEGALRTTRVTPANDLLAGFEVFDTGTPNESTGAVVAAVRARLDADAARYEPVLERIGQATRTLRAAVETLDAAPSAVHEAVRTVQRALGQLGVVPPAVEQAVAALAAHGVAAKLSGAGALTGTKAGSLLVYHHKRDGALDVQPLVQSYRRLGTRLGASGVRHDIP